MAYLEGPMAYLEGTRALPGSTRALPGHTRTLLVGRARHGPSVVQCCTSCGGRCVTGVYCNRCIFETEHLNIGLLSNNEQGGPCNSGYL